MRRYLIVLIAIIAVARLVAQQPTAELNQYYYYPGSFGIGYRQVTPFADFASSFSVYELTGTGRMPLPSNPLWFGVVKSGIIQFDSQAETEPEKWDHQHFYLAPGVGLAQRLSKEFEVGAEIAVGVSQSIFPNALEQPVGSLNFVGAADAKLTLNPSFNVSIDINPGVRYLRSFSPFHEYDGLSFGFGIAAHYRFGRDPDSAESLIRALRFGEVELPDVFAAMQSFYVNNPVGEVTITNSESYAIEDLQVSFFQNGFMDSATPSERIARLEPGESVTVGLLASFNDEVFAREGITPVTGEVIATYTARGRPAEQRQPVTYDMHDKTALTWDDDRKVGAFITPADSALRNYASYVRRAGAEATVEGLSDELEIAMQLYHGLAQQEIFYQEDPTSPFTRVQENAYMVDSISLPRSTLTRATGDCDDLTVLYCSLLESLGVQTGFITVPGHIYTVFNTGVSSRDYESLHPDREMIIDIDGDAWIPVEVTLIGRESFLGAWKTGIELWNRAASDTSTRGFYLTSAAQEVYRPVGLREQDLGLQYSDEGQIRSAFVEDRDRLVDSILSSLREEAEGGRSARAWNSYGIAAATVERYSEASRAFRQSSLYDRELLSPRINLGSVSFLQADFRSALGAYLEAERLLRARGRDSRSVALAKVLVNISRTHYALENYDEAEAYFAQAAEEGPEVVEEFNYLANVASEGATGRASEAGQGPEILFVEEE